MTRKAAIDKYMDISVIARSGRDLRRRLFMKKAVLMIMVLFVITSCGTKEVKVQPRESTRASTSVEQLQKIREYYVKKDAEGLRSMITAEGFKTIAAGMKSFDSVELQFTPRWVELRDDGVVVSSSWDGTWRQAGQTVTEKGSAMFLFKGTPLKLDAILRDSPFIYP